MSRVGANPIIIEKGIEVSLSSSHVVTVKNGTKSLDIPINSQIDLKHEEGVVLVRRKDDSKQTRSFHGLYRSLIYNAVVGVSKGWSKQLELNGVGYKAAVSDKVLELNLGFSHPIKFAIPKGIEVKVEKQTRISISGIDKELVGRTADKIRSFRPPEPYLGKGVKYADEKIRRKAGKSGGDKQ